MCGRGPLEPRNSTKKGLHERGSLVEGLSVLWRLCLIFTRTQSRGSYLSFLFILAWLERHLPEQVGTHIPERILVAVVACHLDVLLLLRKLALHLCTCHIQT